MRAAAEMLARDDEFSVKEVAREAGVATGLVYHYFDDRDALLRAVVENIADGFTGKKLRASLLDENADWFRVRHRLVSLALRRKALRSPVAKMLASQRAWLAEREDLRESRAAVAMAALDGLAAQALLDDKFDLAGALRALEKMLWNS